MKLSNRLPPKQLFRRRLMVYSKLSLISVVCIFILAVVMCFCYFDPVYLTSRILYELRKKQTSQNSNEGKSLFKFIKDGIVPTGVVFFNLLDQSISQIQQ